MPPFPPTLRDRPTEPRKRIADDDHLFILLSDFGEISGTSTGTSCLALEIVNKHWNNAVEGSALMKA